jgi:hypothetical protein
LGELRQQVAARLVDLGNPTVVQVKFSIFTSFRGEDFANLASAYRGSLSGSGDLDLDLHITLRGPLSKAQLEQQCEKLPAPANANYAARIMVEVEENAFISEQGA